MTTEPSPSLEASPASEPLPVPSSSPAPDPSPEPSPFASAPATAAGTLAPDGSPVYVLHPQQFTALAFGLCLVVLLLSALVVAQLRRPRA